MDGADPAAPIPGFLKVATSSLSVRIKNASMGGTASRCGAYRLSWLLPITVGLKQAGVLRVEQKDFDGCSQFLVSGAH